MRRRARSTPPRFVLAVELSADAKLTGPGGPGMAATYAPQQTCPPACPLLGAGCYAEHGRMAIHTRRLNAAAAAAGLEALQLAQLEADAIDRLTGWRPLRRAVVGDCATPAAAALVGAAMQRYERRHGFPAWGYTHAWPDVPAAAWQGARVIASCEDWRQLPAARRQGYAGLALIIPPTDSPKAQQLGPLRVIPCPAQFRTPDGQRRTTCDVCHLCRDLAAGVGRPGDVVGFQPDAQTAPAVLAAKEAARVCAT
jgi:hypothetical protein